MVVLVINFQKWDVCESQIYSGLTVQKKPRLWFTNENDSFGGPLGRFKIMLFILSTSLWKYTVIYLFKCDRHLDYFLLRHIIKLGE